MKLLLFIFLLFSTLCLSADFFRNQNFRSNRFASSQDSNDDEYYQILGVDKKANSRDIKTAYRKKAMILHPDKGGDQEAFKKLVEAYEILGDKDKREKYDRYGKAGVTANGAGMDADFDFSGSPFGDIFKSFQSAYNQRAADMPVVYNLELGLEDYYNGREFLVNLQTPFSSSGEAIKVKILPGMEEGMELQVDSNQGQTGNGKGQRPIIFVLKTRRHPTFARRGMDLCLSMKISLFEALTGFSREITQLDGQTVTIGTAAFTQQQDDDKGKEGERMVYGAAGQQVFKVSGLGMPYLGDNANNEEDEEGDTTDKKAGAAKKLPKKAKKPQRRGDLYVVLTVDLPRSLHLQAVDRQTGEEEDDEVEGIRWSREEIEEMLQDLLLPPPSPVKSAAAATGKMKKKSAATNKGSQQRKKVVASPSPRRPQRLVPSHFLQPADIRSFGGQSQGQGGRGGRSQQQRSPFGGIFGFEDEEGIGGGGGGDEDFTSNFGSFFFGRY